MTVDLFGNVNAATADVDGEYRYALTRIWDDRPLLGWCMLNPSKATADVVDPTMIRCVNFAKAWGYGGIWIGNLFALRSTSPRALYKHADPIGPRNDEALRDMRIACPVVVCAWGTNGGFRNRDKRVLEILTRLPTYALRVNADGSPEHPLYIPNNVVLIDWPLTKTG